MVTDPLWRILTVMCVVIGIWYIYYSGVQELHRSVSSATIDVSELRSNFQLIEERMRSIKESSEKREKALVEENFRLRAEIIEMNVNVLNLIEKADSKSEYGVIKVKDKMMTLIKERDVKSGYALISLKDEMMTLIEERGVKSGNALISPKEELIQLMEGIDKKIQYALVKLKEEVMNSTEGGDTKIEDRLRKLDEEVVATRSLIEARVSRVVGLIEGEGKNIEGRMMELTRDELSKSEQMLMKEIDVLNAELGDIRSSVSDLVVEAIETHEADGIGRADYALAIAGGYVLNHSEIPAFQSSDKEKLYKNPQNMLLPSFGRVDERFCMAGNRTWVDIMLISAIIPEAFSLEHVAESVSYGTRRSAPKHCRVTGWMLDDSGERGEIHLLAEFTYRLDIKRNVQTFDVCNSAESVHIRVVRLEIMENYGNDVGTCIYRFRVHGRSLTL